MNRLVYFEDFDDINQAISREKEVKRLTRRRKIESIDSSNPDWGDLSLEWEQPGAESGIPPRRSIFYTHLADSSARAVAIRLVCAGMTRGKSAHQERRALIMTVYSATAKDRFALRQW
jgi:hypothetical protein